MKRVVITGMSAFTPIGSSWGKVKENLQALRSGIVRVDAWERYTDLRTRLGGVVNDFKIPEHFTRKVTRSMGRVAAMSAYSAELALRQAGLFDDQEIRSGNTGIAYGSSSGTPTAVADFTNMILNGKMDGINANTYIRMMSHTAPVNMGMYLGVRGRIIPTSSACTSGSQGIGYAYEAIKYGMQTMMIAGGAEELDASQAAVFDTLFATSTQNDNPTATPRPFDRDRDGLVIGEGAGTLILEELEHAKARGVKIYAELVGFHCNSDGRHITQPSAETMQLTMEGALRDAHVDAQSIGYINAHGTATDIGDIAESAATYQVFGEKTPLSSLKSYIGHTLGACGAIEAWASVHMMNDDWFAPTLNLENIDSDCAPLNYIIGDGQTLKCEYVMSNNFAFGGINTSLIFKRWNR